ncbi:hypothetical protein B9Z55_003115 [Caenorhabditis nigoni]|uniref:Decapping nuclease n=2 Tax=Caenorhabditis nigoni TaxID=1611254 RepID=A0A2G5VNP9_9PELO|nr:hypothetical protein B9Z55_003115 [Caenorhabditis nigoni]
MECDSKIKISTIDYYHRDGVMNVFCGEFPKKLNGNRIYFEDPLLPVPQINLAKKSPNAGASEIYMESLLKYIRQNSSTLKYKPHFVTTRHLLCYIASEDYELLKISAIRMNGIIYLFKTDDNTYLSHHSNHSEKFRHFFTKSSAREDFESDEVVRKGVFIAEIPKDQKEGGFWKVMYSGVVAAIDESMQHYEMKVFGGSLDDIAWKVRCCSLYWQAVFSDSPSIILGTREWKRLETIRLLHRSDIPPMVAEADPKNPIWKVEDGEKRLQAFLDLVAKKVTTRVSPATSGRILVGFWALLGRIMDKTATKADQDPTNFRPTSDLITAGAGFGSHY